MGDEAQRRGAEDAEIAWELPAAATIDPENRCWILDSELIAMITPGAGRSRNELGQDARATMLEANAGLD